MAVELQVGDGYSPSTEVDAAIGMVVAGSKAVVGAAVLMPVGGAQELHNRFGDGVRQRHILGERSFTKRYGGSRGRRWRMLYARVERTKDGFLADATAYVEELPTLAPSLPLGARSFATDPGHYDFHSRRFIKNLKPERLTSGETDSVNWLELRLRHNCWRHEEDLIIRYHDVRSVSFSAPRDDLDVAALHEVFLDEILPTETGCTHEIACLGGSLLISCADLVATWVDADCPAR